MTYYGRDTSSAPGQDEWECGECGAINDCAADGCWNCPTRIIVVDNQPEE